MSASHSAAAASSASGKARANPAAAAAAALAEVTAKYERSAAVGAEQQKIILALQARNDNLELANRGLDDCRNSMGVILSYIDRLMPHNVDAEHLTIWLKIRKDATAVAHEAKLAREEDEYARVAQQGPPERVLGCPVPGLRMAGAPGGDATPQQPRGKALVDPHPPPAKKAKSSRPEGIIGAKAVYVKTHIDEVRRANPTAGRDLLNLVGKGYEALTDAQKAPYKQSASEQSETNAQLRAEGKPVNKAVGLVLAVDEDGETAMAVEEEPGTPPPRALPAPEDDDEEREARRAAKKKKKTKGPPPPADGASSDEER